MVRGQLRRMSKANKDREESLEKRLLVFVICVILIDLLFLGFCCKKLNWGGLAFVMFLPVFARM